MTSINPSFGDNLNKNLQKIDLNTNVQASQENKEITFGIKPLSKLKCDTVEFTCIADENTINDSNNIPKAQQRGQVQSDDVPNPEDTDNPIFGWIGKILGGKWGGTSGSHIGGAIGAAIDCALGCFIPLYSVLNSLFNAIVGRNR